MGVRTTRRTVISGAGSIAALVATSAGALLRAEGATPDAAIFQLSEAYERTLAAMKATSKPHSVAERAYFALKTSRPDLDENAWRQLSHLDEAEPVWVQALDANGDVLNELIDTPARTMAGVLAKARISNRERYEPRLHASVVADLVAVEGCAA